MLGSGTEIPFTRAGSLTALGRVGEGLPYCSFKNNFRIPVFPMSLDIVTG